MTNPSELTPFSPDFGKSSIRNWNVFFIFIAIAAILYLCPHKPTPAMDVHMAIVDALRAGNNWGRQALVANLDYPVLQSLALLLADAIAKCLHLNSATLLCAIAQAWTLAYLLRCMNSLKSWFAAPIPIALAIILPFVRNSILTLDPNWVAAVPLSAAFYHLVLWQNDKSLRNIILTAANTGFLCLCGIAPALMAAVISIVIYLQLKKEYVRLDMPCEGMRSLLWASFAYCALLWFVWNWLVMDDILFALRDLWNRADTVNTEVLLKHARLWMRPVALAIVFVSPLSIIAKKTDMTPTAAFLLPVPFVLAASMFFSSALGIPMTAIAPLLSVFILSAFILLLLANFSHNVSKTAASIAILACAFFAFTVPSLEIANKNEAIKYSQPPLREDITFYIDQFWPKSRTMLYGLALPALYPDTTEKRFVARLDYQENDFIAQAKNEQMHILVPPPDGRFYPQKNHPLASIHANGKSWLLLEKQWPGGWQLWRAVIPPDNESRLDFMR